MMQRNTPTPTLEDFTTQIPKSYIWANMQVMFTKFIQLEPLKVWQMCLCRLRIQMHLSELSQSVSLFTHFVQPQDTQTKVSNAH
jgi:hypothetical protein